MNENERPQRKERYFDALAPTPWIDGFAVEIARQAEDRLFDTFPHLGVTLPEDFTREKVRTEVMPQVKKTLMTFGMEEDDAEKLIQKSLGAVLNAKDMSIEMVADAVYRILHNMDYELKTGAFLHKGKKEKSETSVSGEHTSTEQPIADMTQVREVRKERKKARASH